MVYRGQLFNLSAAVRKGDGRRNGAGRGNERGNEKMKREEIVDGEVADIGGTEVAFRLGVSLGWIKKIERGGVLKWDDRRGRGIRWSYTGREVEALRKLVSLSLIGVPKRIHGDFLSGKLNPSEINEICRWIARAKEATAFVLWKMKDMGADVKRWGGGWKI